VFRVAKGEGYAEVLRQHFQDQARSSEVVDGEGKVLGMHQGFHQLTVGQRKGLCSLLFPMVGWRVFFHDYHFEEEAAKKWGS
jgi:hypothetical protein